MSSFLVSASRRVAVALSIALPLVPVGSLAQGPISMTELAPNALIFATPEGNVVASVGAEGAFLVGVPSVSSTAQISALLASRTRSPRRYVLIGPQDSARAQGDAGWGRLGASVIMHENALGRLGGRGVDTLNGIDRPRIAFSEVITFDLNGESIHVVHQPAGYSDADALVHFHKAGIVYLGETFPGDGYPLIDAKQKGTLDGLIRTLEAWAGSSLRIVPARGPVVTGSEVKEFRDMLVAVRDRVRTLVQAGRNVDEVTAARPSAEYDARWGRGRVTPDVFVRQVYRAVSPR